MSSSSILSHSTLKQQIEATRSTLFLPETEDSWETISHAITSLCAICRASAFDFSADLVPIIRSISRPLTNAMNSERTRLSGGAMDLVSVLASGLGPGFDPLLPIFLPVLLTLCGRTNKVVITRSRTCIFTVIDSTQLPSILPYFLPAIKEKSASLRLVAAEGTLMCMNCFNPPDLEKETRARDIEVIIRTTARDAHADVRKVSKKLFEAYKLLLPSRVESFTDPLTPTIKKYLDIKNIVAGSQPVFARPTPTTEVKNQLSSSTSSLSSARVVVKSYPHTRSTSSVSSSNGYSGQGEAAAITKSTRHAPVKASGLDMPPPQYVPVRPTQSSTTTVPVSRSTSSVDARKRTVSVRPGAVSSRVAYSGFPVRPTSASGLREAMRRPHCTSTLSNSSEERSTSGPRRVPLPEVKPQESEMSKSNRSVGIALTRSVPSHPQPRVNPAPIKTIPERSKPTPQPRGIGPSSATGMPLPSSGKSSRSIAQPTLSQLSRANATERKLSATTTVKPRWGQSLHCKPKLLMKSSTNPRIAHGTSKPEPEPQPRPITPCQIPLPPSPSPPETPCSAVKQKISCTTPAPIHLSSPAAQPPDTVAACAKAPPKAGQEVSLSSSGSGDGDDGCERTPPEPTSDDCVLEIPSTKETPRPSFSSGHDLDISTTKTPISALLTSIQHGFLLTPSSPLSPPQSYLYPDSVSSEEEVDLSTRVRSHTADNHEQTMVPLRKPFMFGVAGEDIARHAFSDVENWVSAGNAFLR